MKFITQTVMPATPSCKSIFTSILRSGIVVVASVLSGVLQAAPEKPDLTLGFIKLTDMAPLAIAKELGYFEEEGLNVTLVAQPNWQAVIDGVISGELDGAHMLPGQALATAIDGDPARLVVAPFSMDLNGNGITVSNEIWEKMKPAIELDANGRPVHPISASTLLPVLDEYRQAGQLFNFGMVFPVSTHNYELRYWLAAGGVHPGYYGVNDNSGNLEADVQVSVIPPPQMPSELAAGNIQGYSVGEPWNQQAVADKVGVPVIADYDIWNNNPEKVFGLKKEFVDANPETVQALLRALIRATHWLDVDDDINRGAVVAILSRPEYVGASAAVIGASMTGTFEFEPGDVREYYDFNVFYRYFANYPFYSDAVWTLTQMRRWGQIADHKADSWYDEVARLVYLPELFMQAAQELVNTGVVSGADFPWTSDGYKDPTDTFVDGISYDGRKPNAYLESLEIGLKEGSATR